MTEKDQSDPLASNAARNILAAYIASSHVDLTEDDMRDTTENAEHIAQTIVAGHTITWERGVNAAGVAVRRYVARSAWEVDPNPPFVTCPKCGGYTSDADSLLAHTRVMHP